MKYTQSVAIHMMSQYEVQACKYPQPAKEQMGSVFLLCRSGKWSSVLECVRSNPWIAMTPMVMDNHISTTILHQAITSKGDTAARAKVVLTVLDKTPMAAAIKNGYGSLPLHVISQRNTKMDAQTKERLIFQLVQAYKGALMEEGGVGKRTPLHIIFTDYISPGVTGMMIKNGADACFMKDKQGYLPAHVACSRHCSPQKIRMLLSVHPGSLHERTNNGDTLLSLATRKATKSHPNYALIDELNHQIHMAQSSDQAFASLATPISSEESDGSSRGRLNSNDTVDLLQPIPRKRRATRKRKQPEDDFAVGAIDMDTMPPPPADADLLLHFSRNGIITRTSMDDESSSVASDHFAQV